jgi:hypothetical protein
MRNYHRCTIPAAQFTFGWKPERVKLITAKIRVTLYIYAGCDEKDIIKPMAVVR